MLDSLIRLGGSVLKHERSPFMATIPFALRLLLTDSNGKAVEFARIRKSDGLCVGDPDQWLPKALTEIGSDLNDHGTRLSLRARGIAREPTFEDKVRHWCSPISAGLRRFMDTLVKEKGPATADVNINDLMPVIAALPSGTLFSMFAALQSSK